MIATNNKIWLGKRFLPILIALLVLGSAAAGAAVEVDGTIVEGEYGGKLTADGENFILFWQVSGESVYFAIRARATGWVSLGIEPSQVMADADMIFGWVNPDGSTGALDCFSTGLFGPHPPDEELGGGQHITAFAGSERDGITSFEFSRPLAGGDDYDKPLSADGNIKIIWASSDSDDYAAAHNRRGSAAITLAGVTAVQAAGGVDLYGILYRVHGALMSAAFVLIFTGMFFPRYLKKKKWWLKIHRRMGISGALVGAAGIAIAVYMIVRTTGIHLRVLHSWIGLLTIFLMAVTPLYGHFMLKIRKAPDRAKRARAAHRWIGRITLLFMALTIVLGLLQAGIL